jgi:hypothetical protein
MLRHVTLRLLRGHSPAHRRSRVSLAGYPCVACDAPFVNKRCDSSAKRGRGRHCQLAIGSTRPHCERAVFSLLSFKLEGASDK